MQEERKNALAALDVAPENRANANLAALVSDLKNRNADMEAANAVLENSRKKPPQALRPRSNSLPGKGGLKLPQEGIGIGKEGVQRIIKKMPKLSIESMSQMEIPLTLPSQIVEGTLCKK